MNFQLQFDFNSFKRDIYRIVARVDRACLKGMDSAMAVFRDDCLNKVPKCPVDTYNLAQNHHVLSSLKQGSKIIGRVRVNTPYAASIHSGIRPNGIPYQYTHTPDEGAFWGSSKLMMYGDQYIHIATHPIFEFPI